MNNIPPTIQNNINTLEKAGYEAYIVGGCTRDLLLERKPKDWDITTNATPEQIIALFPKTFYENDFGTVGVVNEEETDETLKIVEITPYRVESEYTDFRRPDNITFSKNLEDDIKRRDFTINAIAARVKNGSVDSYIDLYGGIKDIKDKSIKCVGNADSRLKEDALRMMRAVRIMSEIGFTINKETEDSIKNNAELINKIAKERVRDEFIRIVKSDNIKLGIEKLSELGILKHIIPELERSIGIEQKGIHIYDVWEHLLRSAQCAADKKYSFHVRLAALFHDISKPETRKFSRETDQYSFYGHEVIGSRVTKSVLERLKFDTETISIVKRLVRWHMFFSDTETISLSAVRRMINNVGKDYIWELMNLRVCDRIGTGRPKEDPYRLRKYHSMIEEALRDPITVGMLKVDGEHIMKHLKIEPGPKIGFILHALLEEVIEDSAKNTIEYLEKRAIELNNLEFSDLKKLGLAGKEKREDLDNKIIEDIRKKHHVS